MGVPPSCVIMHLVHRGATASQMALAGRIRHGWIAAASGGMLSATCNCYLQHSQPQAGHRRYTPRPHGAWGV